MQRRTFLKTALAGLIPVPFIATRVLAAPKPYVIGPKGAKITYSFLLSGTEHRGTVPVNASQISIDPNNLAASRVEVSADVRRAKTGLIFATEALKSPSMLHAKAHPNARFVTTSVRLGLQGSISKGAVITGDLTLRGVTHSIRFDTSVFRAEGSAAHDLSALTIRMRGSLSRKTFGINGYQDLVADTVRMDIDAEIRVAS
ncbi:YceI family protein [Ascidiaceihabitans sp.]|uniref:YceI family protein n=1 Tax=Ascidiaceihabitans sp. TaxID=1872644 RepID=UPI00329A1FCF